MKPHYLFWNLLKFMLKFEIWQRKRNVINMHNKTRESMKHRSVDKYLIILAGNSNKMSLIKPIYMRKPVDHKTTAAQDI